MLRRKDIKKLLRDVAQKMNTGERHAFNVLCSCRNKKATDEWEHFNEGNKTQEWFVDVAIDIMTDKIYLFKGVVNVRYRAKSKS